MTACYVQALQERDATEIAAAARATGIDRDASMMRAGIGRAGLPAIGGGGAESEDSEAALLGMQGECMSVYRYIL